MSLLHLVLIEMFYAQNDNDFVDRWFDMFQVANQARTIRDRFGQESPLVLTIIGDVNQSTDFYVHTRFDYLLF